MARSSRSASRASSSGGGRRGGESSPFLDPRYSHLAATNISVITATHHAAVRGQEEIAALLLRESQDARATETHLRHLTAERERRIQGIRSQMERKSVEIQELRHHLNEVNLERRLLAESNDHLASEMSMAGAEIQELQQELVNTERDRQHAEDERNLAESRLSRAQEALQKAETAREAKVADPPAYLQSVEELTQDRGRALASVTKVTRRADRLQQDLQAHQHMHTETQRELNRLRAVYGATIADLDQAVQERSAPELARLRATHDTTVADLARAVRERDVSQQETNRLRARVAELEGEIESGQQTANTLGGQVCAIAAQRRGLSQDLARLSREHEALERERAVALRQLSMITAITSVRPSAVEEVLDPAYLLSIIRAASPGSAAPDPERPNPLRTRSAGRSAASTSSRRDRITSSKRDRDAVDSMDRILNPDPNPTPPARRRIFPEDQDTDMDGDQPSSASTGGGEIDDDGGNPVQEDEDPENPQDTINLCGDDCEEEGGAADEGQNRVSPHLITRAEEEDLETAVVADELFEAQTLEAMSQSRSAERRRQHASPLQRSTASDTSGPLDSDPHRIPDPRTHPDPDAPGRRVDPSNQPAWADPLAPVAPFGPEERCIPGREVARVLLLADCNPWVVARLSDIAMVSMSISVLFPVLPTAPGWLFPYLDRDDRPSYALEDYCHELITEANVRDLYDTVPWEILESTGNTIAFERRVGGRLGAWIQKYRDYEDDHIISYWESTHSFPIPDAMAAKYPWLLIFQKERDNRRSHAGRTWKRLLELFIAVMRDGWCDLDLLLDPRILHFPKRCESVKWYPGSVSRQANQANPDLHRPEPADLLEALDECNNADPWRNHYRDTPQHHPARSIARLSAKFHNLRAVGDDA